jgi:thiopeptide-type bacteriocin biosynthesis protein
VDELVRGAEILRRLARRSADDDLARFRGAFVDRYQGGDASAPRWVPLVEALDEEAGVGFGAGSGPGAQGAALLDRLPIPPAVSATVPWGMRETFLLGELSAALSSGAQEIVLGARDLDELADPEPPPLPDAFAVLVTLAAASEEAVARGDFRLLLEGVSGPSGALLLGRFCHADPTLKEHVETHLRAEEALKPDAVFVEVVHLPEDGHTGNVILRPALRDYEIPYLGQSGVPADRQLPVTDLQVAVAGEQAVLRSVRLGRRVLPRLTCAHNFTGRGQGVYRFLGLLQGQGTARAAWDWGPLGRAPFLPRIVTGRLVLSAARWLLSHEEIKTLSAARGAERFRAAQRWRADRRLPRWVALADSDNVLPVDLDNVLSVETLIDLIKWRDQATIVELFPGPDNLCARGPEGRFVHELVVPFLRTPPSHPTPLRLWGRGEKVARRFAPGSEWLYAKLYAGPAIGDQVLRDVVRPVVTDALSSGAADGWFFIRYGDPDWHLRLRLHGDPGRLHAEVLPALQAAAAPLLADGRVWRLQMDTYEREVERYGGPEGIALAERLFQADSVAILALADQLAEDSRGELRWRLALCGMDRLLSDLGFELAGKRAVLSQLRGAFAQEFRADVPLKRRLGEQFRQEGKALGALLDEDTGAADELAPALAALRGRSERVAPVAARLRACAAAGRLTRPLAELAASYLHMHANRALRSGQRAQEMVLYDFLHRLYESRAARARPAGPRPAPQPVRVR